MDDQNNRNLVLTIVLSMLVVFVWMVFFPPPEPAVDPNTPVAEQANGEGTAPAPGGDPEAVGADAVAEAAAVKIPVDTALLAGSISTYGGRLDDLSLKKYRETTDPGSEIVRLLAPLGEPDAQFTFFGWEAGTGVTADDLPTPQTVWTVAADSRLTIDTPVTLTWDNGNGLIFTRTIAVDDHYMFTVTDSVENTTGAAVAVKPYASISRVGLPSTLQNIFVVHEGIVRRTDGEFNELDYADMVDLPVVASESAPSEISPATTDGWIGFTDHYWMTTLIPPQGQPFTSVAKYVPASDTYRAIIRYDEVTIAPGAAAETTTRLFAGAKEWDAIGNYEDAGIPGFIDSIDWGWFYFLTKPIFAVLHWLNALIGNMGLAIIGLTFILKVLVLPLAYKSYVSMARMKELQPEIEALKERAGEDKQRMQKEMMQLYKDRKVNPAAGCLPVLIQIPIFFALYKVIFVTIELRHAPFFGWLNDLSAPDSSSIFNLFGLLPWAPPEPGSLLALIFIGILPILLGITMWLQQKLNPAPADPIQQQIFAWMPWIFMFMLGGFASGLVVYWITNNTITFVQQYLIMRSHGHKPDLFGNIKSGLTRKPAVAAATPAAKPVAKPAITKPETPPANRPAAPRNRKPRR
jgi:YidC/Oxa1 family membrane protein insertase